MFDEEHAKSTRKVYTVSQALEKARQWCAVQDRCHSEARLKIHAWGIYGDEAEAVISALISEGFINEERFARSYARGKFRIKHWGRIKIIRELKTKKVSPACINKGLDEIDEEEYLQTLKDLFQKRKREIKETNPWKRKAAILNYLTAKGFEQELIYPLFNEDADDDS